MIGIVDMEMGNLRSVSNAVHGLGYDFLIVKEPSTLTQVSHLIIPGVGSYAKAIKTLTSQGLLEPIRDFVAQGKPLMGICLGMQLLSTTGDEGGSSEGLGLIPGAVSKIPAKQNYPVPHIGWNGLDVRRSHPILKGLKPEVDFYFIHSYQFMTDDLSHSVAMTDYGIPLAAIVGKDNVVGCQFHPEKSQANGLKLLENFCDWDGRC